jgi:lipopolysaccharide biosynthesis glycosyltransferase
MNLQMRSPPVARNAICFCTDRRMLVPALFVAASIQSARRPSSAPFDIIMFAEASDVDDSHRQWMERHGIELRDDFDMAPLRGIAEIQSRLSEVTLVKLIIAQHLAGRYDKLLYLDADLTIHADLSCLFALDTGEFPFAAVPSGRAWAYPREAEWKKTVEHFRALGMTPPYRFFNSGMLYIDVAKWNAADLAGRTLSFIARNPELCFLPDEHGLNAIVDGRLCELSPIWNARPMLGPRSEDAQKILRPAIVHHVGMDKPWRRSGYGRRLFPDLADYEIYEAFLSETPWPNWLSEQWGPREVWLSSVWEMRRVVRKLRGKSDELTAAQRVAYFAALRNVCETGTFADVEQGITVRRDGVLRLNESQPVTA